MRYPRGLHLKTKTQLYPTVCQLHCWKPQAKQLIRQEHSPTHWKKKWNNKQNEITNKTGEMYGESNMETYNTICKIDSQWEFAVCLRELKQGLCINLEGWDGREMGGRFKRERRDVFLRLIHVKIWQKTKFCKAIILQVKNK